MHFGSLGQVRLLQNAEAPSEVVRRGSDSGIVASCANNNHVTCASETFETESFPLCLGSIGLLLPLTPTTQIAHLRVSDGKNHRSESALSDMRKFDFYSPAASTPFNSPSAQLWHVYQRGANDPRRLHAAEASLAALHKGSHSRYAKRRCSHSRGPNANHFAQMIVMPVSIIHMTATMPSCSLR